MIRHKALLRGMTAAERAKGRFMRSPDGHEGGDATGEAAEQATETVIDDAGEGSDESTVLGGDAEGAANEAATEEASEGDGEAAAAEGPPEAYALTASEGVTLDPETLAEADPVFRELGLTNDGANKLVPIATKFAERIAAQAATAENQLINSEVTAQRKSWEAEAKADPELGGPNWDNTVELATAALDALGFPKGSSFRGFLAKSGLGNHPEVIRAFRRVGERVSEDGDFVRGDMGAQVKLPREAILYPNDVRKAE